MRKEELITLSTREVLVLDGAMGTMIQAHSLTEEDYRGNGCDVNHIKGYNFSVEQKGNNDLLCLTRPDIIEAIHRAYVDAGADIISTCTFNANAVSMRDYATEDLCRDINRSGAALARRVADQAFSRSGRRVLVAGSMGPTNKAASMSPDIANPAMRDVTYDDLFAAYTEQIEGLLDGGADLLLFETVFDTLNLKAGLAAAEAVMLQRGIDVAIMVSLTLSAQGGRTLSGQTLEAFLTSILHTPHIASIGLNCSFGPEEMYPHLKELSSLAPTLISSHPNAGLPDEFGKYGETPEMMASTVGRFLNERLVNIIGGCCGTTPEHIRAIAKLAKSAEPHIPVTAQQDYTLRLSGLEPLEIKPENNFVNIGERCNVAGSRKFLRLIKEKSYDEALAIARKQVEAGALILDINIDDGMLDTKAEITTFLNLLASEPEIAKVPVMIDSSSKDVIRQALKCVQGKSIVNSISLKEGEEAFLEEARMIHSMGAAMVVMAFDEEGQATTFDRKIAICQRAYKLLTEQANIAPSDIIFDPNILTIATGIEEHDAFAADFIAATAWIKQHLPGAKVSGGVSNLSFAFRGNNYLREAMHAVFLYHAIQAGMDMAILNPSTAVTYSDIEPELRLLIEDVVLNRRKGAAEELAEYARNMSNKAEETAAPVVDRKTIAVHKRLIDALTHGNEEFLKEDIEEALTQYSNAMSIIEGPLLEGMNRVGILFGEGKMFLPQVVKTARTMNKAVEILRPTIDAENSKSGSTKAGTIVIATVKGDVHDIGKNIVSIVMACNNYEVIDLGVMVPAEKIVATAKEVNADIVCLSGLITPSLAEMAHVAEEMQRAGLSIPLFVGGATTSKLHTAIKIAPLYRGVVAHISDAARNPIIAAKLLNAETRNNFTAEINAEYELIRTEYAEAHKQPLTAISEARNRAKYSTTEPSQVPTHPGRTVLDISINEITEYINWRYFFNAWKMQHPAKCECGIHHHEEAEALQQDAMALLQTLANDGATHIKGVVTLLPARRDADDILVDGDLRLPMLRQQSGDYRSLADYIAVEEDYLGLFGVTAGLNLERYYAEYKAGGDSYKSLLLQSLCDRMVEASAEWLHHKVRTELWGYAPQEALTVKDMWQNRHQGIRPAVGYPSLPDQSLMHLVDEKLRLHEIGVTITENGAMSPTATISGLYIANPDAEYFTIGELGEDQVADYALRRGITTSRAKELLRI
jgi:5-methyltetrahydrofolate--homocysteine methyltransferase